jgi:succinate-semialdehyde dehydrogenase / glutarate-semialdehyde dehydrogenase
MLSIRNPRTGQYDYTITPPSSAQLQKKTQAMRQAQMAWANADIQLRINALQAWKVAVEKHKTELVEALVADTGRHWETVLEADLVASSVDRWCKIALDFFQTPERKRSSIPFLDIEQGVVPFSLVGVISPWNFPLLLSLIDTIPALLAGCAVIVKPSEVTPRFIKVMEKTIAEVEILRGVFSYVEGAGKTGSDLIDWADLICFTGSTATGRKVYQRAAKRMMPVFLELGGKDAALVFESADLDLATSAVLWGSTANAGQSCLSVERVYVQATIFDEFVGKLTEKAAKIGLAYPSVHDGKIGPIISDKQVAIINAHLEDAVLRGAKIETGSRQCERLGGGFYCRPTVLTNVDDSMKVMTEETFGPIMPVVPFQDAEHALELADSTIYGLSGAVFSQNPEDALAIGKRMTAGAISINDAALTAVMHEGEKNSFKLSGIGGTRMGASAIKRFMRQKAYLIKNQPIRSPWYF